MDFFSSAPEELDLDKFVMFESVSGGEPEATGSAGEELISRSAAAKPLPSSSSPRLLYHRRRDRGTL